MQLLRSRVVVAGDIGAGSSAPGHRPGERYRDRVAEDRRRREDLARQEGFHPFAGALLTGRPTRAVASVEARPYTSLHGPSGPLGRGSGATCSGVNRQRVRALECLLRRAPTMDACESPWGPKTARSRTRGSDIIRCDRYALHGAAPLKWAEVS